MNISPLETIETKKVYSPQLQEGATNEAFLEYGATEVQVAFGRNTNGEIVILEISTKDGASSVDTNPTQPFPKYLQNPTTFSFFEQKKTVEGQTLREFFEKVLVEGNADIREVTAATKLLLLEKQEMFEGVKSPENIETVYNKYYKVMLHALNSYANNPKTAEKYPDVPQLMKDLILVYETNGPTGILRTKQQAANTTKKYASPKYSDKWMTTDEFGVYGGSQEILSFTQIGQLYRDGKIDLNNFKVGMNVEFVPAAQNVQIILTGGGLQRFSDPSKHEKIFKGKDDKIDEELKTKVMKFYDYLIAARAVLNGGVEVNIADTQHFADAVCTVVMEVIQETGKDIIPTELPDLKEENRAEIIALLDSFAAVDLKPNPDIATVKTAIIYTKSNGKVENADNTADEILDPIPVYISLQELLILIDQGIIEDQRLIAATGVFLARELYKIQ
jgi:hypothetical protein